MAAQPDRGDPLAPFRSPARFSFFKYLAQYVAVPVANNFYKPFIVNILIKKSNFGVQMLRAHFGICREIHNLKYEDFKN